jgi:hypothetical protein
VWCHPLFPVILCIGNIKPIKPIVTNQNKQSLGYNTNRKLYNTNGKYRIQIENYTIQTEHYRIQMENIEYK